MNNLEKIKLKFYRFLLLSLSFRFVKKIWKTLIYDLFFSRFIKLWIKRIFCKSVWFFFFFFLFLINKFYLFINFKKRRLQSNFHGTTLQQF